MEWFGPGAEIEIIERGDGLLVRSTGVRRVSMTLFYCLFCAVMAYMAARDRSLFSVGCFLFVLCACANALRVRHGELWVTETELQANGNLGGWTDGSVRLRWSAISNLTHCYGPEDGPSGLYAGGTCVMEGVDEEQCLEITTAIYRNFPHIEMAEPGDEWSLLNRGSGITTLGLSTPKE